MKKLEAKLRVRSVIRDFSGNPKKNHHLLLSVLKTPRSYNREVRYPIVLNSVGSIILGKITDKSKYVCQ